MRQTALFLSSGKFAKNDLNQKRRREVIMENNSSLKVRFSP